jgi:FtsP/CotA-like multicopper oxidase with cupredoxin domain
MNSFSRFYAMLALCLTVGVTSTLNAAAASNPACAYVDPDVTDTSVAGSPFQNPDEIQSVDGVLTTTLNVAFTDPSTIRIAGCGVRLRSYNGKIVGPTLRVKPGDVINLTLNNQLPNDSGLEGSEQCHNPENILGTFPIPKNFNCTNLHTHGLHVMPERDPVTGNLSDNVFIQIGPTYQNPAQFTIRIPADHPSGTYWYHPHLHGSTGVQVASGMQGAIIVEDLPGRTPASINAANRNEKIFVLQTLPYDDHGEINDFLALGDDRSFVRNRHVLVNGQVAPTITIRPGEVQRWRFINASFNRSILLQLEDHDLHEIALDGIYLPQVDTWANNGPRKRSDAEEWNFSLKSQSVHTIPGSRSDVLVVGNLNPGRYKLVGTTFITGRLNPALAAIKQYVIAWVDVTGEPMRMALPRDEEMEKLVPYSEIQNDEISMHQTVDFSVDRPIGGDDGNIVCDPERDEVPCYPVSFRINGRVFNPGQPRLLKLNQADAWTLTTKEVNRAHVFHIHTNSFQTTRIRPNGEEGTIWRDTLFVGYGNPRTFFTRYKDFTGKFVLHCHILSHEDLGMMEAQQVVDSPKIHNAD